MRRAPSWEEAHLPAWGAGGRELTRPGFHSAESLKSAGTQLRRHAQGTGVDPTGVGLVRDVTKAVFLEDESGVDVPDGDIPNFLKFPKVFFPFPGHFPVSDH